MGKPNKPPKQEHRVILVRRIAEGLVEIDFDGDRVSWLKGRSTRRGSCVATFRPINTADPVYRPSQPRPYQGSMIHADVVDLAGRL